MDLTIETTIDAAGRIVVPKAVRQQAGLEPGMPLTVSLRDGRIEIEPAPRQVRIVDQGGLKIATPVEASARLTGAEVERTRRALRDRRR